MCVIVIPWIFGGYAVYNVEAAFSGMLPVSFLRNDTSDLNTCIAPLASYNNTLPFNGYRVSHFSFVYMIVNSIVNVHHFPDSGV